MSTRSEIVTGVPGAAAFGMMAGLGLGLGRTDGLEPWLAGALAIVMAIPCLSTKVDPTRPGGTLQQIAENLRADWARRANSYGLLAIGLFIPHLALWLGFGVRFWPLGLAVAVAAVARVAASGLTYATEDSVPRWSRTPTLLLWMVQAGAAGLLGLSAIEGLLGFPPGLVVWKAALALIGLGLAGQLWHAQAGEVADSQAPWVRTDSLAQQARQKTLWLFRGAIFFGLGVPMVLAIAADGQTERVLMPLAFVSHLAGLAMHRLLFFAEARGMRGAQ
jgi:DMSO reductase anchor subunit